MQQRPPPYQLPIRVSLRLRLGCSAAVFEFFPAAARARSVSSNLRLSRYRGTSPDNLVQPRFETPETTHQRNEVFNNTIKCPHRFRRFKVYSLGTKFALPGFLDRVNGLLSPRIIIPFFPQLDVVINSKHKSLAPAECVRINFSRRILALEGLGLKCFRVKVENNFIMEPRD